MRAITRVVIAAVGLLMLTSQTAIAQGAFDVAVSFELSDTKIKANPAIKIHIEQPAGQPEMGHVTLKIPKGFKLPPDAKIENGDVLGSADLSIDAGPGCRGLPPPNAPATFPDREIVEQDRTDEQTDRGVKAVWVVDLQPVTSIPLEVTGSKKKGWKLDGDIPANDNTCPPIVFDAEIGPTSTTGGVPLLINAAVAKDYVFKAIFTTQQAPDVDKNNQIITLTP
ncbi:MAG TPA: hypothetical protein VE174_04465 [Actinomycetota bacterium]|nr:hypothetical protein [Actinomycetota bacterium]